MKRFVLLFVSVLVLVGAASAQQAIPVVPGGFVPVNGILSLSKTACFSLESRISKGAEQDVLDAAMEVKTGGPYDWAGVDAVDLSSASEFSKTMEAYKRGCAKADLILRIDLDLQLQTVRLRVYYADTGAIVWDDNRSISEERSDLMHMARRFNSAALAAKASGQKELCPGDTRYNVATGLCQPRYIYGSR